MNLTSAIEIAKQTRLHAKYTTTSNYYVGACLVTKAGKMYSGCNIENCGIQSICAERTAFVKALSEGENDFSYIVVVGGKKDATVLENCLPCGYCRQFMVQYVDKDFKIYACFGKDDTIEEYTISDLLPHAFTL
ncbi:MAG: cytidine deaminase [Clostridia bacterium]|jgi:cytidine deaminase|nr:cytidine deaminase [Clostridia bacterium]